MTKLKNIKNYYIKKKIIENTLQFKNNAKQIRLEKENTLQNQLWENLINRMRKAYDSKNIKRTIQYRKLIGCDENQLYIYLEKLLPQNLKIEDYPKWEIDHIKPICTFDLTNENEQLKCFNYTNLQLLLKSLNQSKSRK